MSSAQSKDIILKVDNLAAQYGKVSAVMGASLDVRAGSIVTVIGANGAGKSTLLNSMMGSLPSVGRSTGSVQYEGQEISHWEVERRVAAGISLVPERRELFGSMTV
ncbi:MAG TPA: ABC transporter ATP-binding protein, partial [Alcaligenes faecalis]|nr:ABC transporter ATP-binding protein [Alcaligenes faecalis]